MAGTATMRKEARVLSRVDLIDELQRPTGNWNEDVMRETLLRIYENLTKHNNDFKKVLVRPDVKGVYEFECNQCKERVGKWKKNNHVCQKPIPKS